MIVRRWPTPGKDSLVSSRRLTIFTGAAWLAVFALMTLGQDAGSSCIDDRGCGAAGELVWIATIVLLPTAILLTVAAIVTTVRQGRRSSRPE